MLWYDTDDDDVTEEEDVPVRPVENGDGDLGAVVENGDGLLGAVVENGDAGGGCTLPWYAVVKGDGERIVFL